MKRKNGNSTTVESNGEEGGSETTFTAKKSHMENGCPPAKPIPGDGLLMIDVKDIATRRNRLVGRATQIHYPSKPLYIGRGEGAYLYDEAGSRYLDLQNNVAHVGHCHPKVVAAGAEQLGVLNTNSRYWIFFFVNKSLEISIRKQKYCTTLGRISRNYE